MGEIVAKSSNGVITFNGSVIVVRPRGFGKTEQRIPISMVTAVHWKPPTVMDQRGYIRFETAGTPSRAPHRSYQSVRAAMDPLTVTFGRGSRAEFEQLRDSVEAAIGNR